MLNKIIVPEIFLYIMPGSYCAAFVAYSIMNLSFCNFLYT